MNPQIESMKGKIDLRKLPSVKVVIPSASFARETPKFHCIFSSKLKSGPVSTFPNTPYTNREYQPIYRFSSLSFNALTRSFPFYLKIFLHSSQYVVHHFNTPNLNPFHVDQLLLSINIPAASWDNFDRLIFLSLKILNLPHRTRVEKSQAISFSS